MAIFPALFSQSRRAPLRVTKEDSDRLQDYSRYLHAYRGFRYIRTESGVLTTNRIWLRHNLNRPIVNLGAAFLAAAGIVWKVRDNEAASTAATDIWDRSGSQRILLDAARTAGIYGDVVGLATQDAQGRAQIEFVCPDICFPTFDGSDSSVLRELEITWQEEDRLGKTMTRREFYGERGREVFVDGELVGDESQTWDAIPAVWIRNLSVKGMPFGFSDLDGLAELVEEYDHVARKRTEILDYYAKPTIIFQGIRRSDLEMDKNTALFLNNATDTAKAYFLEWSGSQPAVEEQLDRIRNDISEVSQVPAVAFGRQDSGLSNISGVALRILYGPLLAKTEDKHANFGPSLEYLMWLCLRAEGTRVNPEDVTAVWGNPLPANTLEAAQEETLLVEKGLRSARTAMENLGTEDPDAELELIQEERKAAAPETPPDAGKTRLEGTPG